MYVSKPTFCLFLEAWFDVNFALEICTYCFVAFEMSI